MSVISTVQAMPNRIAYACEALSYYGSDGCDQDKLEALLSPLDILDDDSDGKVTPARNVLSEVIALKFAGKEGQVIKLDEALLLMKGADWIEGLQPLFLKRLTDEGQARAFRQELVPFSLAWLLVQNPFEDLQWSDGHLNKMRGQFESNEDPVIQGLLSTARYQNLVAWARYLGLAERVNKYVIPDPSLMILKNLSQIFNEEKELRVTSFIDKIVDFCPVIDGGGVRTQLEQRLNAVNRPIPGHLSQSLSLAFKRLEVGGYISLHHSADADSRILHVGGTNQNISVIKVGSSL